MQKEEIDFFSLAQETLKQISDNLEDLMEKKEIPYDLDIEYNGNDILEIKCISGTYVININNSIKEIWLSSPISGPDHFKHKQKKWTSKKSKKNLHILLNDEFKKLFNH